jgi:hypothetical protein
MTKDEALAMDLALAALENWKYVYPDEWDAFDEEAITAIKQARSAPVQKRPQNCGTSYCSCIECVMEPAQQEPPCKTGSQCTSKCQQCVVQEPVWIQPDHLQKAQKAPFLCRVEPHKRDDFVPLYTTPPTQPAPVEPLEYRNAVEGWVKIDEVREHFDSVGCGTIYKTAGDGRVPLTSAQRQWVGLTVDELITLEQKHMRHEDLSRAIEAKLKEKNT